MIIKCNYSCAVKKWFIFEFRNELEMVLRGGNALKINLITHLD